jgi:chloramphenicol O-acetyltransferase type A
LVIPWTSFTSLKHARRFAKDDSISKIVFGKFFQEGNVLKLPISVEVNHAMMDGFQIGKYLNELQKMISS